MPAGLLSEKGYNSENLHAESQKSTAKGQMPWAMRFLRNTQKPDDKPAFSWFGGAREHASETFFGDLSLLGALWSTSGRALATLGRSVSALGSSLAALGGHLAPKGSIRDPLHLTTGCDRGASNAVLEP